LSVLDRILAYKRDEVAVRKTTLSQADLDAAIRKQSQPRGFARALREADGPALIAEIKKASPSKGLIREIFDPPALARAYALGGAACLSVLTDAPSFQGHEEFLINSRKACALPVLRKDFLIDEWQVAESRAIGADAILIIKAAVDDAIASDLNDTAEAFGMDALVEVHDEREMERALRMGFNLIGVNNRSLATFKTDLAVTDRLASMAPEEVLLVSESGISTHEDVTRLSAADARAFLVGESLMRQEDVEAATRALLGR
jgi:indole-3-glycerol phosphate synthase